MSKSKNRKRRVKDVIKLCIFSCISITAALALPYFFEQKTNFIYTLGAPWAHETLIAPISFSIEKSPKKYEQEIDSIKQSIAPYFVRNIETENRIEHAVEQALKNGLFIPSDSLFDAVIFNFNQLCKNGICSETDFEQINSLSSQYIKIYYGNQGQQMDKKKIHDPISAYNALISGILLPEDRQIIQLCNIDKIIEPNISYDRERTELELNEITNSVSRYKGQVVEGQKIIDYGSIVDEETFQIVKSLENKVGEMSFSKEFRRSTLIGQIIFSIVLFALLGLFLFIYRPTIIRNQHKIFLTYAAVTFSQIITGVFTLSSEWDIYILPFTMSAIVLRIFMDSRSAFMTYLTQILLSALLFCPQAEFIIIQLITGLVAIYSMHDLTQRSQLFKTTLLVLLTYCILHFSIQLIHLESWKSINYMTFISFGINAVLLLFTYPLVFIVEKVFGFASNVTLVELSNINHQLLRELSETAPGTFQHCMQVSVLAAEGANAVGANALFARTGALYHDIGKMNSPIYFTENQKGQNPHDMINNEESAKIIISHVTQGLELADKYKLPQVIKDCIAQHHGKGLVKYFYLSAVNSNPEKEVSKEPFTYPGPAPQYKETAILMMADAIEAASRSLKSFDEKSISELVDRIINGQVADHMFDEAPITMREINTVKQVFKEKLKSMHHTRIIYPEEKK
ncbi:MAG: HDIG domain-containing protein [Bacteroidaceae bacterium]|nr:HDIG domain-containing protein [Bacteroidaceae bacterium]